MDLMNKFKYKITRQPSIKINKNHQSFKNSKKIIFFKKKKKTFLKTKKF